MLVAKKELRIEQEDNLRRQQQATHAEKLAKEEYNNLRSAKFDVPHTQTKLEQDI